jgi:hypothetical protein
MRKGVFAPNTAEDALKKIIFVHAVGCAPSMANSLQPTSSVDLDPQRFHLEDMLRYV